MSCNTATATHYYAFMEYIYAIEMMVRSGGRLACGCIAIRYYQNDGKNHGRPAATNGSHTAVQQTFQQTAN